MNEIHSLIWLKIGKGTYQCTRYEILGCERMSVTDLLFTASDFADHYGVVLSTQSMTITDCATSSAMQFERVTLNKIQSISSYI